MNEQPEQQVVLDQAKESLREVVKSLHIDPGDAAKFADQIRDVESMMEKLEHGVIHIAAFGMVSRGKSALLNALIGRDVFEVGPTHGTTRERQSASWSPTAASGQPTAQEQGAPPSNSISKHTAQEQWRNGVSTFISPTDSGPRIELIDTPGLNEVDGEVRAQMARDVARRADLLLFVVSGDMLRPELEALAELRESNKPIILVFNMVDLYPDVDRQKIYDKIRNERVRELLKPDDVVLAAARPRSQKIITRAADGTTAEHWETPEPMITPLKLKILEVLKREGTVLAALNSMLFLNDVHGEIVKRRMELREEAAESMIWKFTVTKAVVVACNPVVFTDVAGGLATDLTMVLALARLYGIPMNRAGVGKLVVQVGKMAGLFTATEVGTHMLIGAAKSFFAATSLFTGGATIAAYAAVAPIQAFAAGYTSRVIGEAAKVYLRNGASWGPAGPKTVIQSILDSLDRESVMSRIREELSRRLRA